MREQYAWFEHAIKTLEETLHGYVTIIDNQGLFHTPKGKLVFPAARQSHRKLQACQCGFSSRCIDFCRHQMSRECLDCRTPFSKTCWKGLTEIVVPLYHREQHWGMFYLGVWKTPGFVREAGINLPAEFDTYYNALPPWREAHLRKLSPLLEAFTTGMIARLSDLNAVGSPSLDRAGQIQNYLSRHASSNQAGLAGLAAELHLSPSRTSRLIRQSFGRSFSSLIHEVRINRAKVLLLSTEDKLAAIAAAIGFSDEYHFSRIFRKLTGQPPGEFRRS